MIGPPPADTRPFDFARAQTLCTLLGPDRLVALLDIFAERLVLIAAALDDVAHDRRALQAIIHKSCGSAGTLGLIEVTVRLQAIEREVLSPVRDGDPSAHAARLRHEIAAIIDLFEDQRRLF